MDRGVKSTSSSAPILLVASAAKYPASSFSQRGNDRVVESLFADPHRKSGLLHTHGFLTQFFFVPLRALQYSSRSCRTSPFRLASRFRTEVQYFHSASKHESSPVVSAGGEARHSRHLLSGTLLKYSIPHVACKKCPHGSATTFASPFRSSKQIGHVR